MENLSKNSLYGLKNVKIAVMVDSIFNQGTGSLLNNYEDNRDFIWPQSALICRKRG